MEDRFVNALDIIAQLIRKRHTFFKKLLKNSSHFPSTVCGKKPQNPAVHPLPGNFLQSHLVGVQLYPVLLCSDRLTGVGNTVIFKVDQRNAFALAESGVNDALQQNFFLRGGIRIILLRRYEYSKFKFPFALLGFGHFSSQS